MTSPLHRRRPVARASGKANCTVFRHPEALGEANGERLPKSSCRPKRSCRVALPWTLVIGLTVLSLSASVSVAQQTTQKFCGKTLADAMDRVCVDGYNGRLASLAIGAQKRDANRLILDDNVAYELEPSATLMSSNAGSPFLANFFDNLLATTRRRRNGGIYEECCRKSCSYGDLAAYCRLPTRE